MAKIDYDATITNCISELQRIQSAHQRMRGALAAEGLQMESVRKAFNLTDKRALADRAKVLQDKVKATATALGVVLVEIPPEPVVEVVP